VKWDTLESTDHLYSDMGGRCKAVADTLEKVCGDIPGEQKVRGKITNVVCSFGKEESVAKKGTTLEVSMKRGQYDFPSRVQSFFK
jgi:hypothetical protein